MKRLWIWLGRLFVLSLFLNFLIELVSRKSLIAALAYVIFQPLVFGLNGLLVLAPFLLVLFTRRKLFLCAVLSAVLFAMGAVNSVLLIFRTTPFTAADFKLVKYGASLLTTYLTVWQIGLAVLAILAAAAGCVLVYWKMPLEREPVSVAGSGLTAAAAAALIWVCLRLAVASGLVAVHFGNIGQAFLDYGFPYCFANSLFNTGIEKPEEYGQEAVAIIEEEQLVPENPMSVERWKTPNVIMVQLESFFDPQLWKDNPVEEDPIPYFRFLWEQYPSGYLSVPSVGAGTANTEFECITGMNLDFFGPGEYPYKTVLQKETCESMAFDMKELGYHSHAIHNNEATFYDRHKVFSQLGFDAFTPIEYMYDMKRTPTGWCKDEILTGEIEKVLESSYQPDFIYTISVQGHGKYPSFEYYCKQIHEMDDFIKELVAMLQERKEPTVLALYGDHLPGFEWTEEEMENGSLYQTKYVIWNNLGLENKKKDLEAYQLAAYLLDLVDLHEGTMIRFHQSFLNREHAAAGNWQQGEAEDEEAGWTSYLEAMKILEYDMLYGEQEVYGGSSPYQATRMEMGTDPIIQQTTTHKTNQIVVFGRNFNQYSKICVNGKPVDTPYYQEKRLIAPGVEYQEGEVITVEQIGRDKVPLGTARKGPGA